MHRPASTSGIFGSVAAENRLDVVTIWIEHKCGIVIRSAQAGCPFLDAAGLEGRRVECIDLSPALGCKGSILFDGVRVVPIDPKYRIGETVAEVKDLAVAFDTVADYVAAAMSASRPAWRITGCLRDGGDGSGAARRELRDVRSLRERAQPFLFERIGDVGHGRAVQHAALRVVIGAATMHRAAIVPHHEVADRPAVLVDE